VASHRLVLLLRDRAGVVGILTGLLAVPLVIAVGASVDYAQMAQGDTTLQDAVDNAALAGATVYNTADQSNNAIAVATRYINRAPLPSAITLGTPSVTAAQGTTNSGGTAYNVTVTASATISPAFLSFIRSSFTMTATATASNPFVTVKLGNGGFSSSAFDWDAVWIYPVPMVSGKPVYTSIPAQSTFYEIGSNCSKASSTIYSSSSACIGQTGATVNSGQAAPTLTATQPLGFVLENMTGGLAGYGTNGYSAQQGHINWFYAALEANGQPPSQNTNYSYTTTSGRKTITTTTTYPTTSSSSTPNCSLVVGKVSSITDASAVPVTPQCFSVTSTTAGTAFAAPTCAQINGGFYRFWWNDMGGGGDDRDYNDAAYNVTCTISGGSSTSTQVVLIK
jgi:Flp pilus assembly protein TadG